MSISGKDGTVNQTTAIGTEVCEVTKWTFNPTVSVSKYNSNKTGGHKKGVAGVADSKGSIEIKVDETNGVDLQPGASLDLFLHIDDTGNNYYEVAAIIAGTPIECDIDNGEVVGLTYEFESSGYTPNGALA